VRFEGFLADIFTDGFGRILKRWSQENNGQIIDNGSQPYLHGILALKPM